MNDKNKLAIALNSHYGVSNTMRDFYSDELIKAVESYCNNDVTATQSVFGLRSVYAALDKVYKFCGNFGIEMEIDKDPCWGDVYVANFRKMRRCTKQIITLDELKYPQCDILCDSIIKFLKEKFGYLVAELDVNTIYPSFDYSAVYEFKKQEKEMKKKLTIKKVIFNRPCTIVLWEDGTKTVVRCENEEFDKEKGLAMAICKKALGTNKSGSNYFDIFKKWCE